jgi:hypothetical protein
MVQLPKRSTQLYPRPLIRIWITLAASIQDSGGSGLAAAYEWSFTSRSLTITELHEKDGVAAFDYFGFSVAGAGDVDNDGYDDFIVGASQSYASHATQLGFAVVYSGADGSTLYAKTGENTKESRGGGTDGDKFGWSVAIVEDLNDDGYDEFMVGAQEGGSGRTGKAWLYSGNGGSLLVSKEGQGAIDRFGSKLDAAGDVNNDGTPDLIIGANSANPGGRGDAGTVTLFSGVGPNYLPLCTIEGTTSDDQLGSAVAGLGGDINSDTYDDFIVGEHRAGNEKGRVYVYSGTTPTLIYQIEGAGDNYEFGGAVAGAGDVNNDGVLDFIVGAKEAPANTNRGHAYVYSGADGSLLCSKEGEATGDRYGVAVDGAGDVNGDGYADFIVGAHYVNSIAGKAYLYSGRDYSLLWSQDAPGASYAFGYSVAGIGDVNNDGKPDFAVGALGANSGIGKAYVYISQ